MRPDGEHEWERVGNPEILLFTQGEPRDPVEKQTGTSGARQAHDRIDRQVKPEPRESQDATEIGTA